MDSLALRVAARFRESFAPNDVQHEVANTLYALGNAQTFYEELSDTLRKRFRDDPRDHYAWDLATSVRRQLQGLKEQKDAILAALRSSDYRQLVELQALSPGTARRYDGRTANQAPGARQEAKKLTHPINKPKGIDKDIVSEHCRSVEHAFEEATKPERRDIRPEDVFAGTPNQMGVRNFAETGKDLQKALNKQVPKDKGYATVNNLSQYLIRTDGGGGTKPVG